jgi:alkyl sulfatase BDS1-like metallo-beta-lactamase superfamily hydrolase
MLTEALHLGGKLDWTKPPTRSLFAPPDAKAVAAMPPETFVKLLETKVDPTKAANLSTVVKITFNDANKSYGLALRRGVAEFLANAPDKSDLEVTLPLTEWAAIVTGDATLEKAVSEGKAKVTGNQNTLAAVIASFDPIAAPKEDPNIDTRNY